jgi:trehalose 6-phosphate phosphatase
LDEMKHLLSREGCLALEAVLRAQPLLAFDFDGTLAPIVARPDDAHVAVAVSQRLDRLARLRPLAVVTGRAVGDVARRLGFTPQFIVGNHGAEDPGLALAFDMRPLDRLRARIAASADEFRAAGIQVEDKHFSLALHYRLAPEQRQAAARIEALVADLDPALRCFGGKYVVNVVAAGAPDKGDAVASLVRRAGCDSALFVGDDINDEAVFVRASPTWLTVRVGRDDPQSRAAFFLGDHDEIVVLLESMLGALESL